MIESGVRSGGADPADPAARVHVWTNWTAQRVSIADYAFLSDCVAAALVARNGNVEWLCLGNFPQAFTHLALINAEMHVIRADQNLELREFSLNHELERMRMDH